MLGRMSMTHIHILRNDLYTWTVRHTELGGKQMMICDVCKSACSETFWHHASSEASWCSQTARCEIMAENPSRLKHYRLLYDCPVMPQFICHLENPCPFEGAWSPRAQLSFKRKNMLTQGCYRFCISKARSSRVKDIALLELSPYDNDCCFLLNSFLDEFMSLLFSNRVIPVLVKVSEWERFLNCCSFSSNTG